MKKKTLLALLSGIPDDADVVFERYENEIITKTVTYNGENIEQTCTRIDFEPDVNLIFHGLKIETDDSDEITAVLIRFTE